jgi:hypothetical protein
LSQADRVVYGLLRGASAFLSALARRNREVPPAVPLLLLPPPARGVVPTGLRQPGIENRCPVCRAGFRGAGTCSRCGADLRPLMVLAARAWRLRQEARRALEAGEMGRALRLSAQARGVQDTGSGQALELLSAWLGSARHEG